MLIKAQLEQISGRNKMFFFSLFCGHWVASLSRSKSVRNQLAAQIILCSIFGLHHLLAMRSLAAVNFALCAIRSSHSGLSIAF